MAWRWRAEPDVGVDACGDADMGVAEEFLDDDEVDALLQEQSCGRMAQVVEPDAAEPGTAKESAEAEGEVGGFERATGRDGEDEPAVRPLSSRPAGFPRGRPASSYWRRRHPGGALCPGTPPLCLAGTVTMEITGLVPVRG